MSRSRTALVMLVFALPAIGACGAFLGLSGDDGDDPVPADPDAALDGSNAADASGIDDAPSADVADEATKDGAAACASPPCERYVFLTSVPYRGDLGGFFGADILCNQLANLGDGRLKGREFVAYLAKFTGGAINAGSRLNANGPPFKRLDGTVVASSRDVFMNGPLSAPIDVSETGVVAVTGVGVWTGAAIGGGPSGFDCEAWNSGDAGKGTFGSTLSNATVNGLWTNAGEVACSESRRLYCVEP